MLSVSLNRAMRLSLSLPLYSTWQKSSYLFPLLLHLYIRILFFLLHFMHIVRSPYLVSFYLFFFFLHFRIYLFFMCVQVHIWSYSRYRIYMTIRHITCLYVTLKIALSFVFSTVSRGLWATDGHMIFEFYSLLFFAKFMRIVTCVF